MTIAEKVRAARNPQEALLVIAEALDRVEAIITDQQRSARVDPWGEWHPVDSPAPLPGWDKVLPERGAQITETGDTTEIVLPSPSIPKMAARRMFEQQSLRLATALGDDSGGVDYTEAYVKGGPLWLYHGNRELVMSYPYDIRARMVEDVLEDSPEQAHLMSIDILKHGCEVPDVGAGDRALGDGQIG